MARFRNTLAQSKTSWTLEKPTAVEVHFADAPCNVPLADINPNPSATSSRVLPLFRNSSAAFRHAFSESLRGGMPRLRTLGGDETHGEGGSVDDLRDTRRLKGRDV